jgi:hypothetical protein
MQVKLPTQQKPPTRNWNARDPFHVRFAPVINTIVATLTLTVLGFQVCIYLRQANIMNTQATLAQAANELTKDIQSAFLTASDVKEEDHIFDQTGDLRWRFTPIIENSGNTPTEAELVMINPRTQWEVQGNELHIALDKVPTLNWHEFEYIEREMRVPYDPDSIFYWPERYATQRDQFVTRRIFGPKARITPYDASTEVTWSAIQKPSENSTLSGGFLYGSIHYNDMLRKKSHVTKYCFMVGGITIPGSGEPRPNVSPCRHWNCVTDESCKEDREAYDKERAAAPRNPEEWARQHGMHVPGSPAPAPPSQSQP